jgi:N-methylhydantoinase A
VAWGRGQRAAGDARKGTRRAHFTEIGGFVECPVYARERLDKSAIVQGPAIVEQLETNVVVGPGQVLTVHRSGALLVKEVESGNA